MPRTKHDLFISHSGDDGSAATEIRAMFEGAGYTVWMAPDDIAGSRPWADQIVEAIDNSRAMVVLLSSAANGSPYVSREVNLAFSRKRAVLPIRLEPVAPEAALELFLALVQRVDAFPPPLSAHRDTILRRLELTLDEGTGTRRRAPRPRPSPKAPDRTDTGEATRVPGPAPAPTPTPAPAPPPSPSPESPGSPGSPGVGSRVGAFTIEAVLGEGGMATVYRARQAEPNRAVALKVIRADHAADPTYRQRFLSEKDTLASLEHPSIIPIYAAGDDRGVLYIAMRLVDGNDLAARIKRQGRLSLRETIEVLEPIADAVDYAHSKGVVHRDLKPSNIVLDHEGRPYLTDFGLGKRVRTAETDASSGLSAPGIAIGTLAYMAPEQLAGDATDAGAPAIDRYAFGALAFTCLTGHAPYPTGTPEELAIAQANGQIPSVLTDRPDLPKAVDTVLRRALAKRPADRYPTARGLVAALDGASIVTDQSTEIIKVPERVAPWEPAVAWVRAAPSHAIVAAVLVVALAFGAIKGWSALTGAGPTPSPTPGGQSATPTPGQPTPTATPITGVPQTPGQFQALSPFPLVADISWQAAPGAVTYRVYRDGALVREGPATETSFRDVGLASATLYTYSIEAVGATGTSARADSRLFTASAPANGRLEDYWTFTLTYTAANEGTAKVGDHYEEEWGFTPSCETGACDVEVDSIHGGSNTAGKTATLLLNDDGTYRGTLTYSFPDTSASCGTDKVTDDITLKIAGAAFDTTGGFGVTGVSGSMTESISSTGGCVGSAKFKLTATAPTTIADIANASLACKSVAKTTTAGLATGLQGQASCTENGQSVSLYIYANGGAAASAFDAYLDRSQTSSADCSGDPVQTGNGAWTVAGTFETLGRVACGPDKEKTTYIFTWSYLRAGLVGYATGPSGGDLQAWWQDPANWLNANYWP